MIDGGYGVGKSGSGGGGGTPSAPDNSVQFNNAGAFGGSANLTWASDILLVGDFANNTTSFRMAVGAGASVILRVPNAGVSLGDDAGAGNKTYFTVDDASQSITCHLEGDVIIEDSEDNHVLTVNTVTGLITLSTVPTYADDAAAAGGGLTSGQLYKTTDGGSTFLKIVP